MTNVWHHWPGIDEEVAAIFDPFGNAVHTALSFPVLGEDVLVTGAGPIGLMAIAVARHAGARHIVASEPNAYRRELARTMGATLAVDPTERDLADVQAELGMTEGFDVAMEMSGNPAALRSAIANMAHGGRIAILGIPSVEIPLDFNPIIFKMLTLKGIYGREMYETWYMMTVMLQSGLDIRPAITHRFSFRDHAAAFAAARSGDSGKVIMDWQPRPMASRRPAPVAGTAGTVTALRSPIEMSKTVRPEPLAFLAEELADLRNRRLYRPLRVMSSAQGPIVSVDGRRVISLSSNDYLGLTHHPRLRAAALAAVESYGAGSGAVRTIAGTMTLHEELEAELARFKGVEAVLTFQSGFTANTGVIPTVTGEQDLIVTDALNHASIIDGMRLSKAPRKIYPHADVAALREILAEASATGRPETGLPYRLILVVTDGVFSMDGDIAPLPGIVEAAEEAGAAVMVDDAHASGVLGRNGRGSVDHFGLHGRVAIQVGTLSKAVGVLGGYVAGSQDLRDLLTQRARPFLFSTSQPAGRRRGLPRGDPRPGGRARAHRAALGEHPAVQGRAHPPRLRHRGFGDPDHAGDDGRLGDGRPVQRPAVRRGRLRPADRLSDGRPRQGPDPDDRHGRPHRRAARYRPGGVRPDRPGARAHRRVTVDDPVTPADPQARDLPLDAHLHTDRSADSAVPIDVYAAAAVERRIAELAITDHIDFDPRLPNHAPDVAERERIVREAAQRWGPLGVTIRFGLEVSYESSREAEIREHLADHPYDFVIGSVHVGPDSPYRPSRVAGWVAGRPLAEALAPYFDEVRAAAASGLFDTLGHLDFVKRYLAPHVTPADLADRMDLYEPILRGARRERHRPRGEHERAPPGRPRDLSGTGRRGPLPGAGRPAGECRVGCPSAGLVRPRPRNGLPDRGRSGLRPARLPAGRRTGRGPVARTFPGRVGCRPCSSAPPGDGARRPRGGTRLHRRGRAPSVRPTWCGRAPRRSSSTWARARSRTWPGRSSRARSGRWS